MVITLPQTSPETVRSEVKRRQILGVAREIFLKEGYAAASMSAIAARLGGSKGTLYNYFRSKEELFGAFIEDSCRVQADAVFDHMPPLEPDLRGALVELAHGFLGLILSETIMAVQRVVIGESGRFPEVGRIFYESGPKTGEDRLKAYFADAVARGLLIPASPLEIAKRFKDLVLSDLHLRVLWGVLEPMSEADLKAAAESGVDAFLRVYAA
jgi:TetR/AcrR family transcriptional repressor of mexJK operon